MGRLRRQTLKVCSESRRPPHPLVCIIFQIKSSQELRWSAGRRAPLPARHSPDGSGPSLSPVTFLPEGDPPVWAARPAFCYRSCSPCKGSVRQLKAFLWRCYLISGDFQRPWSREGRMCAASVRAGTHSFWGRGVPPAAPLSVGLLGSREMSCFGNTAFSRPRP